MTMMSDSTLVLGGDGVRLKVRLAEQLVGLEVVLVTNQTSREEGSSGYDLHSCVVDVAHLDVWSVTW